jgi:hypothetical protein
VDEADSATSTVQLRWLGDACRKRGELAEAAAFYARAANAGNDAARRAWEAVTAERSRMADNEPLLRAAARTGRPASLRTLADLLRDRSGSRTLRDVVICGPMPALL